jgi:hypothetical protein
MRQKARISCPFFGLTPLGLMGTTSIDGCQPCRNVPRRHSHIEGRPPIKFAFLTAHSQCNGRSWALNFQRKCSHCQTTVSHRDSVEGSARGQEWDDDLRATRFGASLGASGFGGDLAPVVKRAQNRREGPSPRRQTILHPRRYLVVNDSMDDAIRF